MDQLTRFQWGKIKNILGDEATKVLGYEAKALNATKALIVTDEGIEKAGQVEKALASLKNVGVEAVVYNKIQTDPLDTMVNEVLVLSIEQNCDLIIGFGGGSSMDVAKCASLMRTNEGDIMEYTRINPNRRQFKNNRIPLILVPTTSGTGSEMSPFAVITNISINRKSNVTSDYFYPDAVILDPDLAVTMDAQITVSSGFDALTHSVEAYTIRDVLLNENPVVDIVAIKSIELVANNLRKAYALPEHVEGRKRVMIGAMLAGTILSAGSGAAHGLANMLSKYYHVPHGESVGMLLPYVMEYNLTACPERFAQIANVLGVKKAGMTDMEAGKAAIEAIKQLAVDVKLPKLSDYMKDKSEIEEFLEESLNNSCNFVNARDVTVEAARTIYTSAFYGR